MEDNDFDRELNALNVVSRELGTLPKDAQRRIVDWAINAFGLEEAKKSPILSAPSDCDAAENTCDPDKPELPKYTHFAELFSDAGPRTNEEKVLVAAYWVQAIEGRESWKASELQNLLKNLGEAVTNISDYLTKAIKRKPSRVLQLRKSGNSKQARKTYKLTQHGIAFVEQMMG